MHSRAMGVILAGVGAISLGAQTAPRYTKLTQAPAIDQKVEATLRQLFKDKAMERTGFCSIPLIAVPIAKNLERTPAFNPPKEAENIDHMPLAKLPAPPCNEEKR